MINIIIIKNGEIMRITATIQDSQIKDLLIFTNASTKTGAINAALQDWIAHKKRQKLKSFRGQLDIQDYSQEQTKLEAKKISKLYDHRTH